MALTPLTRVVGADVAAGAVTASVVVLLGAPLGLLWARLAPEVRTDARDVDLETLFIGSREGSFALLCITLGVVLGAAAWAFGRSRGPGVVLGLAVGGALAGAAAAHVGEQASLRAARGATGAVVRAPVEVQPGVALVVLPLAALVVFALLVALLERRPRAQRWAADPPGLRRWSRDSG